MALRAPAAADLAFLPAPELRQHVRHHGSDAVALRKAAQDFEAMALGALFQPMFEGIAKGRGFGAGGKGEAVWAPLLVNEYARIAAANGGLGIGEAVFRHLLAAQERATAPTQRSSA